MKVQFIVSSAVEAQSVLERVARQWLDEAYHNAAGVIQAGPLPSGVYYPIYKGAKRPADSEPLLAPGWVARWFTTVAEATIRRTKKGGFQVVYEGKRHPMNDGSSEFMAALGCAIGELEERGLVRLGLYVTSEPDWEWWETIHDHPEMSG